MTAGYTTRGEIRGECGHVHRSWRAAIECKDRDSRGCRQQGGYSDRWVVAVDDRGQITDEDVQPQYLEDLG